MSAPDGTDAARGRAVSGVVFYLAASGFGVLAFASRVLTRRQMTTPAAGFIRARYFPPVCTFQSMRLRMDVENSLVISNHDHEHHPVIPPNSPHPDKICPLVS